MKKYNHLSQKERDQIYDLSQSGKNKKEIAKILNRDPSTIGREVKRNKTMIGIKNNNNPTAKKDSGNYYYLPYRAQEKYMARRKESKQLCPLKTLDLYKYTIEKLKIGWSPEIISGRAKREGIGNISHECIYQFIYSKASKELKLYQYLARLHKKRRKWQGRKAKRTLIPNRIGIEKRPKSVENRKEFGHWEGDSVVGIGKKSALNTNRERKTRLVIISKIKRKTAKHTRLATIRRFKEIPDEAHKTNTYDNGPEFTEHEKISKGLNMHIYFANPYHSWERGTNENGNGLIRRFFPKKTDFDQISQEAIKYVENWINNRPMKCLDYKTPLEAFQEELAIYQNLKNCT